MRRAPRIGLVGARRARQGLGPFVAKWLARHGAEVVAHAGTGAATVAEAGEALTRIAGVTARGHVGLAAMLESEDLDAVAVLSPPEHHGEALEACLAAGLHVLCEKPLLVPAAASGSSLDAWHDTVQHAEALESGYRARGIVLWENCQWPRTLAAYRELFRSTAVPPRAFEMGLEPASRGATMLTDALSHPLSVLQALLGAALIVSDVELCAESSAAEVVRFVATFRAAGPRGVAAARVDLRHNPTQPRRAWLALDGAIAERVVRQGDYSMRFEDLARRAVPLPDPLEQHLAAFLAALAQGCAKDPTDAYAAACSARQRALATLVTSNPAPA